MIAAETLNHLAYLAWLWTAPADREDTFQPMVEIPGRKKGQTVKTGGMSVDEAVAFKERRRQGG